MTDRSWDKWRMDLNKMRLELALVSRGRQEQYKKSADLVDQMIQLIIRLQKRCRTDSVLNAEYGPEHFQNWVVLGNELLALLLREESAMPIAETTLSKINGFVRATK